MRIYETLKNLMIPELVTKAAAELDEPSPKMHKAAEMILPSLLGILVKKGPSPAIHEVAEYAGLNLVVNHLDDVFGGSGIFNNVNVGERFENAIIGSKNTKFRSVVAHHTGISVEHADRLTNWVSCMIAGWFGNEMARRSETLAVIMERLNNEKGDFIHHIPADAAAALGIGSPVKPHTAHPHHETTHNPVPEKKKKCGWCWIIWLIVILALLALLFCWWRSCERKKEAEAKAKTEVVAPAPKPVAPARTWSDVTLPDGEKIRVYKGSYEEKMLAFLASDEFNKLTNAQLKDRWFHIESIEFKFGSSTELMPGSEVHMKNFEAILKSYPKVLFHIGGYADKVGGERTNMTLSEARAKFIASQMEKVGLKGRVDTHAFGNAYATYPADAPDSLRSRDRDIALRLSKK